VTLTAFVAIYFVQLAAAMSPGPAFLMAARTGLSDGFGRALWLAAGLGAGAVFWAAAALFGLAVLFQIAPALLSALKYAGAAYLLWLAFRMWRHAAEPMRSDLPEGALQRSSAGLFWQGMATQLANPKPAVFFGTIFLTFVPPQAPAWAYAVILGIVFFNDTVWAGLVARLFSLPRTRAAYLGFKTLFERVFGSLIAVLGLKLALT